MPANIDKQTITSAVERYLSARGLAETTPASVESVVDRFLAARGVPVDAAASDCGCAIPETAKPAAVQPAPAPPPASAAPPGPKIAIAEFVCENDVRQAINQNKRIYIGPKTILTPSARDLGNQYDVLVVAQR